MKPQLVEIEKIIKQVEPKNIPIKNIKYDYSKIIFNIISLIMIIIGVYVLYKRKKNKHQNEIKHQNNIKNLYKEIKLYEKIMDDNFN